MRGPHMLVSLPRALHSRGRVPTRELSRRLLEVRVTGGAEQQQQQQWCQQCEYQSPSIREEGVREDIIMQGPHMRVRLVRALHSRGRVPSRELSYSCLEVRVIGGADQQQQQWCQQWQYQSPSIRGDGGRGYHHPGPSQLSQSPEGAPLPRQGPLQRVVVQPPGGASHRRSIEATTAEVVSAVAISITINQRGGGERGYHHAGPSHASQAREGAPLPRQGPV